MKILALLLVGFAVAAPACVGTSAAAFTAGSANPDVTFASAADFNTVAVSMAEPGTSLRGTVALSATAASDRGIASVTFEVAPNGSSAWTTACTASGAPYSCSWDTTGVPDGLKDVRAVARDSAGYSRTSVVSARRVDNTAPTVTLGDPGAALGATTTLASTTADAGSGVASVRYEYRTSPAGTWTTACSAAGAPFSCSWSTTGVADRLYDLRATATDAAGNATTSAVVSSRRVDNTAPGGVTLTNPGTPLQGGVTLSGAASDGGSGIASVRFQYAPAGTTTWTDACVDTTSPYSCAWATTGAPDAAYDMRALATDKAGNTTASATVANRRVDNDGPAVSVTDPGSPLRGSVTVAATASDPAGMGSVTIQYRTSPGGTWTDICTDNVAPYSCPWATTGISDGDYDLRANATDAVSHTSSSAVVSARHVDNTAPTALDVQGSNGGTSGKLDAGDTLTFSYSEAMAPAGILAGWSGSSTPVTVKLINSGQKDLLGVWDAAGTTELPLTDASQDLELNQGWVSSNPVLNATMVQSGDDIVITMGTLRSGSVGTGVRKTNAMVWTPSTTVTDLAGNPCAATAAIESGAADVDF